jgi:phage terminase large subunit-like protein
MSVQGDLWGGGGIFGRSEGPWPWEVGSHAAKRAMIFAEGLTIPEGPRAGKPIKLAPYQKDFIRGALRQDTQTAVLSVARGNGKSAISATLALGALIGVWDHQPRREVVLAARSRDQAAIAFNFAVAFAQSLPAPFRARMTVRRSPKLELEIADERGSHFLRAVSADGRNQLGGAPTFILLDERAHWPADQGDALEAALLSGAGKRNGRAVLISTSAPDDSHTFSRWIDNPPALTFVQEHRPPPGLPADDVESLLIANPGAKHGIGSKLEWLTQEAERAIARGGNALATFRLFNRNERVSGESRNMLLTLDEWMTAEVDEAPPRDGPVIVGLDLGGSSSMTAAAFFWRETGRLEVLGGFPASPSLLHRGAADAVGSRYVEMSARGELVVMGDKVTDVRAFLAETWRRLDGIAPEALVCDRFRGAELEEWLQAVGVRVPIVYRGQGFRDGAEDVERFRRAVFEGRVKARPSLLLRNALGDAVTLTDAAGNAKLAKARSKGRIDAAAAAVLAVAEGARRSARPTKAGRAPVWA